MTKKAAEAFVSQEEVELLQRRVEFLERELLSTRKRLDKLEINAHPQVTDLGIGNIGKSLKDIVPR